jgi:hypothetical protein
MNSKTETEGTQGKKRIASKPDITISEQVMITFDPLRKVNNGLNEVDIMQDLNDLVITCPKLIKVFNFHNEVYNLGKIVGIRYVKQREEILLMRKEIEELQLKLKNYEEFNNGI